MLSGPLPAGHAQVTTNITSSGLGTTLNGGAVCTSTCTITGGTRSSTNLFHSFGQFSVGAGNIANFLNETNLTTTNIISRVTGGSVSNIFGTLQTTGFGSANLYLLNPAGVIFGPGASLNLGGSFHVSTADYLKFANGEKFFVDPNNVNTVLSTDPVAAFGFTSLSPAAIALQGSFLQVPTGQTLSVVGGDITMTGGSLSAPSGRINLASVVGQSGEVLAANSQAAFGTGQIQLTQGARIDASGDPGGTISIRGGRLVLDGASDRVFMGVEHFGTGSAGIGVDIMASEAVTISNGSIFGLTTDGEGPDIHLSAPSLSIMNGGLIVSNTGTMFGVPGTGNGGDIVLEVGSLSITGLHSGLETESNNDGNSGSITIRATESVSFFNGGGIDTGTEKTTANGGRVYISAPSVSLSNGLFTTENRGDGAGGDVVLEIGRLSLTDFPITSSARGAGRGGTVMITASETVSITGAGSGLFTESTRRTMNILDPSGTIIVEVRDIGGGTGTGGSIQVTARSLQLSDGATISARTLASGDAGNISIEVGSLVVTGGARIDSNAQGPDLLGRVTFIGGEPFGIPDGTFDGAFGETPPSSVNIGRGGTITIAAGDSVVISGRGSGLLTDSAPATFLTTTHTFSASPDPNLPFSVSTSTSTTPIATGFGPGGNINVQARSITLSDGATISAKSSTDGNAGNISITASDAFVATNSSVTTEATQADGGDIEFHVGRLFHLINSEITTKVGSGTGSGGNIFIDPQLVLLDGSRIIASAIGGSGGNITIVAGLFLASPDSVINASSSLGISGSISIQAPTTNLSGTLAPLPEDFLQAAALLRARCAAQLSGKSSSFVLAGRDGLPREPGSLQPSPLYQAHGASGTNTAGRFQIADGGLQITSGWQPSETTMKAVSQGCAG